MHVWPQSGFSGENNVGGVIKEELAHKMSKYKYEDGNGNLQKYINTNYSKQDYDGKDVCSCRNTRMIGSSQFGKHLVVIMIVLMVMISEDGSRL